MLQKELNECLLMMKIIESHHLQIFIGYLPVELVVEEKKEGCAYIFALYTSQSYAITLKITGKKLPKGFARACSAKKRRN